MRTRRAPLVETWRNAVESARGLFGLPAPKRKTPGPRPRAGSLSEVSDYDVRLEWLIEESRKHYRPLDTTDRKA